MVNHIKDELDSINERIAILQRKRVALEAALKEYTVEDSITTEKVVVDSYHVSGSHGEKYLLLKWNDGVITCECKGFEFRNTCKHVQNNKF